MAKTNAFHFHNGKSAQSIDELYAIVKSSEIGSIQHHLERKPNDFANWVRHVQLNSDLADDLESANTVYDIKQILELWLKSQQTVTVHKPWPELTYQPTEKKQSVTTQSEEKKEVAPEVKQPEIQEKPSEDPIPILPPIKTPKFYDRHMMREFMVGFVFGVIVTIVAYRMMMFI